MRALPCVLFLLLAFTNASADVSKAWTAAKDNLPANTKAVAAIDVGTGVKSPVFAKLFELLQKEEKDIAMGYALVKSACKLDPVSLVDGVVIAGSPEDKQAVVFLQLTVDRTKLLACVEATMKAVGQPAPTVKVDGIFTAVTVGKATMHVAWVTPDVVVVTSSPDKKQSLQAWIGGKGAFAKAGVGAQVAKVDTKALAWGAFAFDKPLKDKDLPVISGHGTLSAAKGVLSAAIKGTFADAGAASKSMGKAQKEHGEELARKKTPAEIKKVMGGVTFATTGADATLKFTTSEADLLAAIGAAMTPKKDSGGAPEKPAAPSKPSK